MELDPVWRVPFAVGDLVEEGDAGDTHAYPPAILEPTVGGVPRLSIAVARAFAKRSASGELLTVEQAEFGISATSVELGWSGSASTRWMS